MQPETNTTRVAVISIIVENPERVNDINNISGRLGRLTGVTVKTAYAKQ